MLQSDLLSGLASVIVAPIVSLISAEHVIRLNPLVELHGKRFCVTMQDMAGVPRRRLGAVAANLASQHTQFIAAIVLIFTGF